MYRKNLTFIGNYSRTTAFLPQTNSCGPRLLIYIVDADYLDFSEVMWCHFSLDPAQIINLKFDIYTSSGAPYTYLLLYCQKGNDETMFAYWININFLGRSVGVGVIICVGLGMFYRTCTIKSFKTK